MIDTLRADYLGSYGFDGLVSPNLDSLAAESVLFANCFTQAPWTKPSIASLFTSLYPQVHGLTDHEGKYWSRPGEGLRTGVLSEGVVTLAERLRETGYRTGAFVSNPWVTSDYGFAQGFEVYDEDEVGLLTTVDELVDDARAWLDSLERDEPYFLYLHFMDVHAPYDAPRSDFEVLRGSSTVASDRDLREREMPDRRWQNIEVRPEWATDEMRRAVSYWRGRYASGVRACDRRLGAFLEFFRARGDLERSLLVVTSDHGEELFEHGDWSHGQNLFDHQLRVPLLVRNPGGREGGTRVEDLVGLVDLMPTLLSVAGAQPVGRAQGRDVSALLAGGTVEDPGAVFATATQKDPGLFALRTREFKLIVNLDTDASLLFDLREDPEEHRNRSWAEEDLVAELEDRLATHISESLAGGTLDTEMADIPDDLRERLEALGYLE